MKITLITICWNSARTLGRMLDSISAQSRLPDEFIVVDGGSTDGTLEVLGRELPRLEARGVAFKLVKQRRVKGEAGIPSAWNQGLEQATGEVVALLNSDDWYEKDALATVQKLFKDNDQAEVASCPIRFANPDGACVKIFYPKCPKIWLPFLMPLPHPGLFVKKSVYDRLGKYDTRYRISADYDFVWRLVKQGVVFAFGQDIVTNMELGGAANSHRELARNETLEIALRHGSIKLLPRLAWLLRKWMGR